MFYNIIIFGLKTCINIALNVFFATENFTVITKLFLNNKTSLSIVTIIILYILFYFKIILYMQKKIMKIYFNLFREPHNMIRIH